MNRPDFARTELDRLEDRDLRYLIEHFPQPGGSYEEIAQVIHTLPTTLESLLNSNYLYECLWDRRDVIVEVSPFLFFNVLLRRCWKGRPSATERKIINYLANLLSIFAKTDRLYRVQPRDHQTYEYLVELIAEAQTADSRRQFLIYSHIGNYSLFMTGLFPQWIESRHRFKRRPVTIQYYIDFGRSYFHQASGHKLAHQFGLDDVFLRLSMMFDAYKATLNHLARNYLATS